RRSAARAPPAARRWRRSPSSWVAAPSTTGAGQTRSCRRPAAGASAATIDCPCASQPGASTWRSWAGGSRSPRPWPQRCVAKAAPRRQSCATWPTTPVCGALLRRPGPWATSRRVLVFNAAPGFPPGRTFSNMPEPQEIDPEYLTGAFNIGVTGCVRCVREVVPQMLERSRGSILLSGATMALRGGSKFGCVAPVKTALRSLGQSMYQAYASKGVHVAHVVIDGVIESPNTKEWGGEGLMLQNPADLADAYIALHEQKPTVWSYEIMLSPQRGTPGMRM
ncbi:unnamed protein product, partial [Prorocentrum cordatum]